MRYGEYRLEADMHKLIWLYQLLLDSQLEEVGDKSNEALFFSYLTFFLEEMKLKFGIKIEVDMPIQLDLTEMSRFQIANFANNLVCDGVMEMSIR